MTMTIYMRSTLLFLVIFITSGISKSESNNAEQEDFDHAQAQVDWLRSKEGYFNSKLEFKKLFPEDQKSPKGVYASEDISRGELLMIIPQQVLLTTGDPKSEDICDTVRNLMKQHALGETSEFSPYVNYLYSTKPGQIPSSWTESGKQLLNLIHDKDLAPGKRGFTGLSFRKKCLKEKRDSTPEEEFAYLTVHSRSWDDKMIPVYDMLNHRNGHWANVDSTSVHRGRDIFAVASRHIEKGEQLYFPYNECTDCEGFAKNYVLQHMLRDFGFVEQYPQRWMFPKRIVFDVDEEEIASEGVSSKTLKVTWLTRFPKHEEVENMVFHLNRLKDLQPEVDKRSKKLTKDNERYVILDYYNSMISALQAAIDFMEDSQSEGKKDEL